ncbi:MAG: formimidoylglutamase [Flavobacteriaceae bacterium]|nr:formimidoylglutamase [Flavobacteriaceae bacterium]
MIHFYEKQEIDTLINHRKGEVKLGEKIKIIKSLDELEELEDYHIIFGIPEDIGIRGNYGVPGAKNTWHEFLKAFLNIQHNEYNTGEKIAILGYIDCEQEQARAEKINLDNEEAYYQLGKLVEIIDSKLTETVKKIKDEGHFPIAIGGGHNNALGMIQGCFLANEKMINVLNIDAHTDLRTTDYRHSGNGFSYAIEKGLLKYYYLFGIHKNYTPQYILQQMEQAKNIDYYLFEDLVHLSTMDLLVKLKTAVNFVKNDFGLEIDCDAIANFSASAKTPSGFDLNNVRSFMKLARKENLQYLHICEAYASKDGQVGKSLSYLVSDFIRREI